MKYFHLLWRNLWRRKVRTTFTFPSIVVAFFLFGLLMAMRYAFDAGVELAGQNRLLTIHKVSIIQLLPERYLAQIQSTPGVKAVTHMTWFGGIYQDPKNFFGQMAVDPEGLLRIYPEYVLSDAERAKWFSTRSSAIVGRKLAERFGWKVGDRIPMRTTFWRPKDGNETFEFELVGIYEGKTKDTDETQFFFHHDYLMERCGDPGTVGWYIVEVATRPCRSDRAGDRPTVRQFTCRDEDRDGEGVRAIVRQAGRRHRRHAVGDQRRRLLRHPADLRQHHGAVGARADQRARRAEDDRVRTCR
jgi:putative ABC transport system permease protein